MGSLDGVHSTRSIWIGDKEVVQLTFDPKTIEYKTLLENATKMDCATTVFTHDDQQQQVTSDAGHKDVVGFTDATETRDAKISDQKYYLRNTPWAHLPLNECQAVKINAVAKSNDASAARAALKVLSPRQMKLADRIALQIKDDPQAFAGFVFPESADELIGYEKRLLEKLDELEK